MFLTFDSCLCFYVYSIVLIVSLAVVDQIEDGDPSCGVPIKSCESDPDQGLCKYIDQVDVIEVEARLAVGPVFARHIGHRLYRGEYYAMQIDAHVTFVQDWDVDIIEQMDATRNEMTVLSTYLTDIEGSIDETTGKSLRRTRPIMVSVNHLFGISCFISFQFQLIHQLHTINCLCSL